eukprot:TRINITY_DN12086_c0_g1_i1.p1 TRINITY_DN12086_c0_g1~~TRINITY_DN12086_c0_g1_i1.p1  ORF type:complete len:228 (-),score=61.62 TRINITY_DN12086_c0_g1_i1:197-880(-)
MMNVIGVSALLFLASVSCNLSMSQEEKEALISELEHVQMMKELEVLIKNLDDEQLDKLESIIEKDLDRTTEFDMIMNELKVMGMDEQDIDDLHQLAALMNEFLVKVPELEDKLEMKSEHDLLDNVQLYLLGLPNKLGPLGYIALHHVLEGADEGVDEHGDIIDVVIEPESVAKLEEMEKKILASQIVPDTITEHHHTDHVAPTFRRKRSPMSSLVQQVMSNKAKTTP